MNSRLETLVKSDIPEVKSLALRYNYIESNFKEGRMSKSEFDDLTDDLFDLENIQKNMKTLNVLSNIKEAIETLITIKDLASL